MLGIPKGLRAVAIPHIDLNYDFFANWFSFPPWANATPFAGRVQCCMLWSHCQLEGLSNQWSVLVWLSKGQCSHSTLPSPISRCAWTADCVCRGQSCDKCVICYKCLVIITVYFNRERY
jgi:hypothetical protein